MAMLRLAAAEEPAAPAAVPDFFATYQQARQADISAEKAAKLYEDLISANPESPEAAISRVLRGIVLWRDLDNLSEAEKDLAAAAGNTGTDTLSTAAAELGKRWLSRARMTRIRKACHAYYLDEVEYPDSLDKLVEKGLLAKADLLDAWGQPFVYEALESTVPQVPRQKYALKSKNINGESKEIPEVLALEKDYGKQITLKTPNPKIVMVSVNNETLSIEEGQTKGGLKAVRLEANRAILCSPDYVVVLSR